MRRYFFHPKVNIWRRRISTFKKNLAQLRPRQKFVAVILATVALILIRNFWMTRNIPRLQHAHRKFLVNQPGCKIRNFGGTTFSENLHNSGCPFQGCGAYTEIVTVYNKTKTITVRRTEFANRCVDETLCCAVAYSMPTKNNDPIRYPAKSCYQIKPWQEIQPTIYTEVLEITCHDLCDNRKIVNFHPLLPITPKVENKIRTWTRSEYRRAFIRVIILSIDNLSQDEARNNLPRTLEELEKQGVYEMGGYSMIENTTTGNFLAALTGFNSSKLLSKCSLKTIGVYDGCPFIWKDYRNFDYLTLFMDHSLLKSSRKSKHVLTTGDFIAQPTDFFIPAPFINDNMRQNQEDPQLYNSFASTSSTDFILDFTQKFVRKFTNFPFLAASRINPKSETVTQLDSKLLIFFQKLSRVQNSVIIFFSNVVSGPKSPLARPFLYVLVPKWIPEGQKQNLFTTSQRLVTPFDLHQTLHEILLKSCVATGSTKKECLFLSDSSRDAGSSIFRPSNKTRDCTEAQIPASLCPCLSSATI